jgi:membrane protease YdiL (CAAX protease family)
MTSAPEQPTPDYPAQAFPPPESAPDHPPDKAPPSGMFALEGRPAAGLYVVAWLLGGLGLGLLVVATMAGASAAGRIMFIAALATLAIGLAAAAGYQIVARRSRPEAAFHGASPLLLLGIQIVASFAIGTPLLVLFGDASPTVTFLLTAIALLAAYVGVVWLFGVRSGALSWREMGLPLPANGSRIMGDIGMGVVTMLVVWPLVTVLTAILALALDSRPPAVVPQVQTGLDILLTAIGAALLVPIGEELLFRGYALTAWLRDRGPRSALIRSTLFFAFAHVLAVTAPTFDEGARQALLTVVVITPVGATLGWLFLRRGLIASIAGHATFNLIGVILIALAQNLPNVTPPAT